MPNALLRAHPVFGSHLRPWSLWDLKMVNSKWLQIFQYSNISTYSVVFLKQFDHSLKFPQQRTLLLKHQFDKFFDLIFANLSDKATNTSSFFITFSIFAYSAVFWNILVISLNFQTKDIIVEIPSSIWQVFLTYQKISGPSKNSSNGSR